MGFVGDGRRAGGMRVGGGSVEGVLGKRLRDLRDRFGFWGAWLGGVKGEKAIIGRIKN